MALPKPPPAIEIPPEIKRAILTGFRQVIEAFQTQGKLDDTVTHTEILHDPALLGAFIEGFRANPDTYKDIVVDASGAPVTDPARPLKCGVSLEQVQQLMVKTCARHMFMQDESEKTVTKTVTTTRFLIFKETVRVTERVRNKDPRALKQILGNIAFGWQLPLLADYAGLTLPQLTELGDNILALRTPEAVREFARFDPNLVKKAKAQLGADLVPLLESRPLAIRGALHWPKDMYQFFRQRLGARFFEFMARDETFFMMVAALDKPVLEIYGEVLAYIAKENLFELQRLNIDKVEVLLLCMRRVFGPRAEALLSLPGFAREALRRQVEGLLHMYQDKAHLADAHALTWGAAAPQVLQWLAKQQQPKTA